MSNKRKLLIVYLDVEVSKYVRKRPCVKCGSITKSRYCSHLYSRECKSVRWDIDNVKSACVECHAWFDSHPITHKLFVMSLIGEERFNALTIRKNKSHKWEIYELEILLKYFKKLNKECDDKL